MPQYLGSTTGQRSITSSYSGEISRSFKDISISFDRNVITNDVVVLKNEEAIKQSVKNLVLTKLSERLFKPEIGTNTTSYLFELSTNVAANALIEEIEKVLQTYEPRITLQQIDVDVEDDLNQYQVYIDYLIVGVPLEVQNLSFILVRES